MSKLDMSLFETKSVDHDLHNSIYVVSKYKFYFLVIWTEQ